MQWPFQLQCSCAGASVPADNAVKNILFEDVQGSQWRIKAGPHQLIFETRENNSDWVPVARMLARQSSGHEVRLDVGDIRKPEGVGTLGIASIGIEANRGIPQPFFAAVQSKNSLRLNKGPIDWPPAHISDSPAVARQAYLGMRAAFDPQLLISEGDFQPKWSTRLGQRLKLSTDDTR